MGRISTSYRYEIDTIGTYLFSLGELEVPTVTQSRILETLPKTPVKCPMWERSCWNRKVQVYHFKTSENQRKNILGIYLHLYKTRVKEEKFLENFSG